MVCANAKWKQTLQVYEPPRLDASVDEALRELMARKKASMPDIWYQACAVLQHGGCSTAVVT